MHIFAYGYILKAADALAWHHSKQNILSKEAARVRHIQFARFGSLFCTVAVHKSWRLAHSSTVVGRYAEACLLSSAMPSCVSSKPRTGEMAHQQRRSMSRTLASNYRIW